MAATRSWSSLDVCAVTGLTYRQVDYQLRTGLLIASLNPGRGSGNARRFSDDDLVRAGVVAELMGTGLGHDGVRRVLEALAAVDERFVVIRCGRRNVNDRAHVRDVGVTGTTGGVGALIDRWGTVIVVDVDRCRARVAEATRAA